MNRRTLGYALFVVVMIVILALLPFLIGRIDMIYLSVILVAVGVLWFIMRMYMRKTLQPKRDENGDT